MVDNYEMSSDIELICVIVNLGAGSNLMQTAKNYGVSGGTVLLGKGTVNNRLLDFLGLSDVRKEIVLMIADKNTAHSVLDKLDDIFNFKKPNHGIAFTTSVCALIGTKSCKSNTTTQEREMNNSMYQSITVIVEKGKAENVIDAATRAGSKGGTIINARGSGIHETSKLFSMAIEPEKEIVMILSKTEETEKIIESISVELKIDEPGNGIIYIQNVNKTYGVYE